jgi:hypothetical protein
MWCLLEAGCYLGYLCSHPLLFNRSLVGQPLTQVHPLEPKPRKTTSIPILLHES